jgi:hypothetical protein
LKPAVTYHVPAGWINITDWADYFTLIPDTPSNRAAVAGDLEPPEHLLILTGGFDSTATVDCNQAPQADPVSVTAAEVVASWASRAGLETSDPVPVTLSGLVGQQIDVGLAAGWTGTCPDEPSTPSEQLWPGELLSTDRRYRLLVLDEPHDGTITIKLLAPRAEFDAFVAEAMPIVDSFEFDLSV